MDILNAQLKTLPLSKLVNNSGQIPGVPKNPRIITDERYRALVERLRANNLTGLKPLIVYEQDGKYIVLGGNQRLRALRELKVKEVACLIAPPDTPAKQLREAVILDNNNDGENDWDALANEWSGEELVDWGIDAGNWTVEQPEITSRGEMDLSNEEDNLKITFAFSIEEWQFVNSKLLEIADTREKGLLTLLKYEPQVCL